MTQTAAGIRLTTTAAKGRPTRGVIQRGFSALVTALRRSDERRLTSTLATRDIGRQTGVRC